MTTKKNFAAASLFTTSLALIAAGFAPGAFASNDAHGDHNDEGDTVELNEAQIALAKLEISTAGPGTLRQTLPVYGRIEAMPSLSLIHISEPTRPY